MWLSYWWCLSLLRVALLGIRPTIVGLWRWGRVLALRIGGLVPLIRRYIVWIIVLLWLSLWHILLGHLSHLGILGHLGHLWVDRHEHPIVLRVDSIGFPGHKKPEQKSPTDNHRPSLQSPPHFLLHNFSFCLTHILIHSLILSIGVCTFLCFGAHVSGKGAKSSRWIVLPSHFFIW